VYLIEAWELLSPEPEMLLELEWTDEVKLDDVPYWIPVALESSGLRFDTLEKLANFSSNSLMKVPLFLSCPS
jgi:hypothetical protein